MPTHVATVNFKEATTATDALIIETQVVPTLAVTLDLSILYSLCFSQLLETHIEPLKIRVEMIYVGSGLCT
jgi:hypothetical protein